jgi:UDP-glucose-4-epimerase GalE
MARVLVTGGAGYIGSFATQALLRAGHEPIVYDDLSQGHREAVERLAFAFRDKPGARVTLVEGDIRDTHRVAETLTEHRVEAVMHFAAKLIVNESVHHPSPYYDTNVRGALSVLDAMRAASVTHFIFSSTCATFGEPVKTPIDEGHPQRPINAYGETKLAVERALPHFGRAYGLRWVALRYFNAAGADPDGLIGEDHTPEIHLIPRAIDATMGAEALAVFGTDYPTPDGTCLRDYVHVVDLADAHVRALERLRAGGASADYNLGTGRPHSVREILTSVARVTGREVPHRLEARREGDPAALFAANDKVRRELDWQPRFTDLDAIVDSAWQWRRRHPRGYRDGTPDPRTLPSTTA